MISNCPRCLKFEFSFPKNCYNITNDHPKFGLTINDKLFLEPIKKIKPFNSL